MVIFRRRAVFERGREDSWPSCSARASYVLFIPPGSVLSHEQSRRVCRDRLVHPPSSHQTSIDQDCETAPPETPKTRRRRAAKTSARRSKSKQRSRRMLIFVNTANYFTRPHYAHAIDGHTNVRCCKIRESFDANSATEDPRVFAGRNRLGPLRGKHTEQKGTAVTMRAKGTWGREVACLQRNLRALDSFHEQQHQRQGSEDLSTCKAAVASCRSSVNANDRNHTSRKANARESYEKTRVASCVASRK